LEKPVVIAALSIGAGGGESAPDGNGFHRSGKPCRQLGAAHAADSGYTAAKIFSRNRPSLRDDRE
jgi:hypothetical protein